MFVTLFLTIFDTATGRMSFVNAGHTEPYLFRGQEPEKLKSSGNPPVGAFPGVEYREENVVLGNDEKLFLYTDGVNEAYSKDDEQFGEERLSRLLAECAQKDPADCLEDIRQALDFHCRDCEQSDDITMLCIWIN